MLIKREQRESSRCAIPCTQLAPFALCLSVAIPNFVRDSPRRTSSGRVRGYAYIPVLVAKSPIIIYSLRYTIFLCSGIIPSMSRQYKPRICTRAPYTSSDHTPELRNGRHAMYIGSTVEY